MPDDIAYWQQERAKLQQQLDELETGVVEKESFPLIRYLTTRIATSTGTLQRWRQAQFLDAGGRKRPEVW